MMIYIMIILERGLYSDRIVSLLTGKTPSQKQSLVRRGTSSTAPRRIHNDISVTIFTPS